MSTRVLIHDHPHRTVALATDTHALIFRHSHPGTEQGHNSSTTSLTAPNANRPVVSPRCMVEFAPRSALDHHPYRTVVSAKGTLGLITLNNDVFLCVVTGSGEVASVRPGETVQKIFGVEFYCLNKSEYDHGSGQDNNPFPGTSFSSDDTDYGGGFDQTDTTAEHPFHALKKLLNNGNFYYSVDFDLTRRLQDRAEADATVDIASLDEGLLWNSYMISPLLEFRSRLTAAERDALDHSKMLTSVIRGFVKTLGVPPSSSPLRRKVSNYPSTLTVISRLSSRRTGTRFNSRGVDDDGNVANFVETETVFWSPTGICFSYTQIRGSVPVFWESSTSLIPGQQKIQITRSPEATQPAFDKHFEMLERTYGAVHIVNLLSASKPGEAELTSKYRFHVSKSPLRDPTGEFEASDHDLLRETEFDFHERVKAVGSYEGAKAIRPFLDTSAESFVYFMTEEVADTTEGNGEDHEIRRPVVIMQQNGVFRVNCLDCLDRTNLIQGLISQMALELFLSHRSETTPVPDFWMRHSSLWADNGDTLSKIYAGTGALKSSYTRHGKMSLAGAIADARKSATRLYVNNFADKGRQNTIDLLLGRLFGQAPVHLYDPINDFVLAETQRKANEYTSSEPVFIWVGTFNLNGKTTGISEDLSPWLHAKTNMFSLDYEIVAIGFQEIVDLSPQQIMNTDPAHRALWEQAVKESLNSNPHRLNPNDEYVLLRSGQLVGAALMVFVKASILGKIKNVEGAIKKTGMSGIAGNKGAVAIRFDFARTSICIVTAHLAAGFANYEERNRDYRTISSGLRFLKNRGIEDHDSVVWLGDFNYRIGLNYEKTTKLVEAGDLETLYENDQLNIQMVQGLAFPYYSEMRIMFPPTYKFDVGTDVYDTSEKGRIPAWCDRVLRKGVNLRQLEYGCCTTLRFSDHRPVYATFEWRVTVVDEIKKGEIMKKIEERRRRDVEGVLRPNREGGDGEDTESATDSADAEDLMGYESIAEGLPPASSDRRKWWLDGDRPVRSAIGPPREDMVLNQGRSPNPWRGGRSREDEDWTDVAQQSIGARRAHLPPEDGSDRLKAPGTISRDASVSPKPGNTPPPLPAPRGARRMVVPVWGGERLVRQASEKYKSGELLHHHHRGRSSTGTDTLHEEHGGGDTGSIVAANGYDSQGRSRASTTTSTSISTYNTATQNMSPPTPPPRSHLPPTNTMSRSSSIAGVNKKAPPPKPEKPIALSAATTRAGSEDFSQSQSHSPVEDSNLARRFTSISMISPGTVEVEEKAPALPRRTSTTVGASITPSSTLYSLPPPLANNLPTASRSVSGPSTGISSAFSTRDRATPPPPVQPRRVSRLQKNGSGAASVSRSSSTSSSMSTARKSSASAFGGPGTGAGIGQLDGRDERGVHSRSGGGDGGGSLRGGEGEEVGEEKAPPPLPPRRVDSIAQEQQQQHQGQHQQQKERVRSNANNNTNNDGLMDADIDYHIGGGGYGSDHTGPEAGRARGGVDSSQAAADAAEASLAFLGERWKPLIPKALE